MGKKTHDTPILTHRYARVIERAAVLRPIARISPWTSLLRLSESLLILRSCTENSLE